LGKYYKKLYQQKLAEQIHKVQILKEYYEEIEAEKKNAINYVSAKVNHEHKNDCPYHR